MKKYIAEFVKRGLMAAWGGPAVLAVIYGVLGANGTIEALSPTEVTRGILSVTLLAFLAAGISMIYTIERLPLAPAALIHGATLYAGYLMMYWVNNWIPKNPGGIALFTGIFIAGYALIWFIIWLVTRAGAEKINRGMRRR